VSQDKVVSDTTVYKGSFRPKNRGQEASGGVERLSLTMLRGMIKRGGLQEGVGRNHPRKVNTGRRAATTSAGNVMWVPGWRCPVDAVEPLVFINVDNVVVRVAVKSRLGTDVETLVAVKEIEIEETAQKF